MPIRALILDFDGLIVDTESTAMQCWQELYAAFGQTFPQEAWYDSLGRAVRPLDPYTHLVSLAGPVLTLEALRMRRKARELELVGNLGLRPGIETYLKDAVASEIRLAIASSSHHPWVDGHLERLSIRHHFSAIICAEDTPVHKPDPTPYRLALRALGVEASEAIAFEDSPNGIAAAKGAGIFTVAVPNPVTRLLNLTGADLVVDPLTSISFEELLAIKQGSGKIFPRG